jgi:hypothetical protein
VIFVTAHLITPGGLPVNPTEEEEEGLLQPPVLPEVPAYKNRRNHQSTRIDTNRQMWVKEVL